MNYPEIKEIYCDGTESPVQRPKHSIVFQIATYKALPREHVANYKKRWPIEMVFRKTKQSLAL